MWVNKRKLKISDLICLIAMSIGSVALADGEHTDPAHLKRHSDEIRGHGCYGAMNNDYETFIRDMKNDGLEIPNAQIYWSIECGNRFYILENTILPNSIVFLQKFVVGVYKKYGKEEVAKIINTPDCRFGYTLLEQAIEKNGCRDETYAGDIATMIHYLKKVGGTTRPDFISVCKKGHF